MLCSTGFIHRSMEFVIYADNIVETIDKFAVNYHLYTDDAITYAYLEAVA